LWPPGATHRRQQEIACFVEEGQVGATLLRFPENPRELIAFPAVDLVVVTLPSTPLGLLARPAQPGVQETTNMIGIVRDAKVAVDEGGDAPAGPQLVGPAVGLGALEQQLFQLPQL
jgi:hypothetical protein